jgi:serpin B
VNPKGPYPDGEGFQVLELPYTNDSSSMVLVVPMAPGGLDIIERLVADRGFGPFIDELAPRSAIVSIPRLDTHDAYRMAPALSTLGLKRAFTDPSATNGADFSGMVLDPDPDRLPWFTECYHAAAIEVNEDGTTASAASAMDGVVRGIPETVPFHPVVRADRPFLYLIRDLRTGAILFLGRFTGK